MEIADFQWQVVSGCTHVSQGCENCTAEQYFHESLGNRPFGDVRMHPDRLLQPLKMKKPSTIFVDPLGDLFHDAITDPFIQHVFSVMNDCERHRFLILTKRPKRALYQKTWPSNVWLGISAENQEAFDLRAPILAQITGVKRFVSYEPVLGPIEFGTNLTWISWVVSGGEVGPGARRANLDWIRSAITQAKWNNVPFLLKQLGSAAELTLYGSDPLEWDEDLRVQEFPWA